MSSQELADGLQSMVVMHLSDRVLCDKSAVQLMMLETEIQFLRKQLEETQNESV